MLFEYIFDQPEIVGETLEPMSHKIYVFSIYMMTSYYFYSLMYWD